MSETALGASIKTTERRVKQTARLSFHVSFPAADSFMDVQRRLCDNLIVTRWFI